MQHILTGEELNPHQLTQLLTFAITLKQQRQQRQDLIGKHLALLFDKPSLRTRFSFTVAMHELGGTVVESVNSNRKTEAPEDQARVISGYCHVIMMRTHADSDLERLAQASTVPVINGLSNLHHPCQIFADLMTLLEVCGTLSGITLAYIGDGNNILHSLLLLAPQLGVNIHYCCPAERQPDAAIVKRAQSKLTAATGKIQSFSIPQEAVATARAVYTDVWTSMGFEDSRAEHLFEGFQVNEALMSHAHPQAILLHCLPMERGKEVSETLPDSACSAIFRQSENRLHVQKALLLHLFKKEK